MTWNLVYDCRYSIKNMKRQKTLSQLPYQLPLEAKYEELTRLQFVRAFWLLTTKRLLILSWRILQSRWGIHITLISFGSPLGFTTLLMSLGPLCCLNSQVDNTDIRCLTFQNLIAAPFFKYFSFGFQLFPIISFVILALWTINKCDFLIFYHQERYHECMQLIHRNLDWNKWTWTSYVNQQVVIQLKYCKNKVMSFQLG